MSPQTSHALLLSVPSALGLVLLLVHGFTFRRTRVMLGFLGLGLIFGLLRGNVIHWMTVDLPREVAGGFGMMPYTITTPVIRIGDASLQECVGWLFALYLGWCLSERVLDRMGWTERPALPLAGLLFVWMGCICYAVEAGAGALGWWVWSISTENRLFLEVPPAGMWAWPSVAFDFALPFLLIVAHRGTGKRWPWLLALIFPVHMAVHVTDSFVEGGLLAWLAPSRIWHWLMLAAMVTLALGGRRPLADLRETPRPGLARVARWFPLGVAWMLVIDLWVGIGLVAGRTDLLLTTLPLLVFVLLGLPRIPVLAVAGFGVVLAPFADWRGLAVLAPVAAYGLVRLAKDRGDSRRFRGLVLAVSVVFALVMMVKAVGCGVATENHARAALAAHRAGGGEAAAAAELWLERARRRCDCLLDVHASAGSYFEAEQANELALRSFLEAEKLQPDYVWLQQQIGFTLGRLGRPAEAVVHLQRAAELLPSQPELQGNLGAYRLLAGDIPGAEAPLRRALELDPDYGPAVTNLARWHLARGERDEAIALLKERLALAENEDHRAMIQAFLDQLGG